MIDRKWPRVRLNRVEVITFDALDRHEHSTMRRCNVNRVGSTFVRLCSRERRAALQVFQRFPDPRRRIGSIPRSFNVTMPVGCSDACW